MGGQPAAIGWVYKKGGATRINGNENLQPRYFRITKSHLSYYDSEEISMGNFFGFGKTFCGELPIHDNTIYFTRPHAAAELVVWSGPDIMRMSVVDIVRLAPISIKLDDGGLEMGFHNKGNWAQSLEFKGAEQDRMTWIRELQTQCQTLDIKVVDGKAHEHQQQIMARVYSKAQDKIQSGQWNQTDMYTTGIQIRPRTPRSS